MSNETPDIDPERKEWIDNAPYQELLSRWRHDPLGSDWFQGNLGSYFKNKLEERRAEITPSEHVAASKNIGWE